MPCKFKPLSGWHSNLEYNVCPTGRRLFLFNEDDLLEKLPEYYDWTTLAIYDGNILEVVKAINWCGVLVFVRGWEDTKSYSFPCGAYVEFIMTKAGIESLACCSTFWSCP